MSFDTLMKLAVDQIAPKNIPGRFAAGDILVVEKRGPNMPLLTVVDLPGLVKNPNNDQSADDIKAINDLTDRYMKSSRTIILAVVGGNQDYVQAPVLTPDSSQSMAKSTPDVKGTTPEDNADLNAAQNEEMYHYAKLVEIKQKELKTIEKDEPLLYKQFSMDVNRLDSAYHGLQQQLTKNPNREQILEAMLQNLQLQMGLLNHQLDIIKQINHSKQSAYEKAYKTT